MPRFSCFHLLISEKNKFLFLYPKDNFPIPKALTFSVPENRSTDSKKSPDTIFLNGVISYNPYEWPKTDGFAWGYNHPTYQGYNL